MTASHRFKKNFNYSMRQFDACVEYVLESMFEAYHEVMDVYRTSVGNFTPNEMYMCYVKNKFEKLFYNKLVRLIESTNIAFEAFASCSDFLPSRLVNKSRRTMNNKFRDALKSFEYQKENLDDEFDDLVTDLLSNGEN